MNRKIGIRGNALEINGYVRSNAPEVLFEHSRGLSLSWSSCSLRSFSAKRQTWQFVLVSKLSYFFIKCRKLFLFAAVFGVDYLSLIIHLLILLEKLQPSITSQYNSTTGLRLLLAYVVDKIDGSSQMFKAKE